VIPPFRILIVDDNPNNLFTLKTLLESVENSEVIEASSGDSALTIALQEPIHLILLDIQMPGMDGFEVAKFLQLKQATRLIPIVFITAVFKSEAFFEKGYQVGAVDYLTKPIDDMQLLNKVKLYYRLYEKQHDMQYEIQRRQESEQIFRIVFDYAGVGIAIIDSLGAFVECNRAFEGIFSLARSDIKQAFFADFICEDSKEEAFENFKALLSGELKSLSKERRYCAKNGKEVECSIIATMIQEVTSGKSYIVVIATDLTEIRRLEYEKSQKEQMLIQQSKMAAMGEMIGAIAHQWRQPLNALGLLIQDVEDAYEFGELDETYLKHHVEHAMDQISFMSGTIDDFRNFFKPAKRQEVFHVVSEVKGLLGLVEQQFKNHGIGIEVQADVKTDDGVLGYPNEFKQVILNLLSNAQHAIENRKQNQKQIRIVIESDHNRVMMRVSDNGPGIPESIRDKIFEPYFSTKGENGTGIGLFMSHTIIERNMQGRLYLDLAVEEGATFCIELPRHLEH